MEKKLYERPTMEIVQFAAQENVANSGDNSVAWPWAANNVE